jgi:protein tyrosine phosphatase (PTP) superfamily phosphohydrolase (DUF442 family)
MAFPAFSRHRLAPLVLGCALAACVSSGGRETVPAWPPLEPAELGGMHNVAVSDGIWIGSEPSEADLDLAYRRGIRRVISLCTYEERPAYDLRAACERIGLYCLEAAPTQPGVLSDTCVDRALALLGDGSGEKTLMFCPDGSRSAAVFAIERVVREGMPLDQALLEAHRAGLPGGDDELVRAHVERLLRPAG